MRAPSSLGSLTLALPLTPPPLLSAPPLRNLDDVRALGAEVAAKGLKGLKCNLFHGPGFGDFPGYAASGSGERREGTPGQSQQSLRDNYGRNAPDALVNQIVAQRTAFREGAGPDMQLKLVSQRPLCLPAPRSVLADSTDSRCLPPGRDRQDTNYSFKTEGYIKVARALEPVGMDWLELDNYEPKALARIKSARPSPSCPCSDLLLRSPSL